VYHAHNRNLNTGKAKTNLSEAISIAPCFEVPAKSGVVPCPVRPVFLVCARWRGWSVRIVRGQCRVMPYRGRGSRKRQLSGRIRYWRWWLRVQVTATGSGLCGFRQITMFGIGI
jgi:hypothetical protein